MVVVVLPVFGTVCVPRWIDPAKTNCKNAYDGACFPPRAPTAENACTFKPLEEVIETEVTTTLPTPTNDRATHTTRAATALPRRDVAERQARRRAAVVHGQPGKSVRNRHTNNNTTNNNTTNNTTNNTSWSIVG